MPKYFDMNKDSVSYQQNFDVISCNPWFVRKAESVVPHANTANIGRKCSKNWKLSAQMKLQSLNFNFGLGP